MRNTLIALFLGFCVPVAMAADEVPPHAYVKMETTEGSIILELNGKEAPLTVGHFLRKVDEGFYDGLIFHRVIPGFMAQGGGFTPSFTKKESDETIPNESGNGLTNARGTIAMARLGDPHTANTQFFINVADNSRLDPNKKMFGGSWGYAVFGSVIEGMETQQEDVRRQLGLCRIWQCDRGHGSRRCDR
jgi:cyclophilin family peptidyl-prolyl cis-trans isomerase